MPAPSVLNVLPFISERSNCSKNYRHVLHEHGQLVNAIASLVRKDARVILHGPAALCLVDGTIGHVSLLLLRKKNPKNLLEKSYERERLLKRVSSSLTPRSLQCFQTSKFVLVTLQGDLEHKKAELTADPGSLLKWFVIKTYIFEYRLVHSLRLDLNSHLLVDSTSI